MDRSTLSWNFEVVSDDSVFENLASIWDDLARHSEFPTVFALHGFNAAWWSSHHSEWSLRLVIGRDRNNSVRFIGPFVERKSHPGAWFLMGHGAADYESVLFRAGDTEAWHAFQNWVQSCDQWQSLNLHHIATETVNGFPFLRTVKRSGNRAVNALRVLSQNSVFAYRIDEACHPFSERGSFARLAEKTRGRDYRKHANWFSRQGELSYCSWTDSENLLAHLPEALDLHRKKWTAKKEPGAAVSLEDSSFLRRVIERLGHHGAVRLDLLLWKGQPIASHVGFEWNGRLYWYLTAYDPDYGSHSPGKLLLAYVIQAAASSTLLEIDFLRGQEAYKYQYASEVRKTSRVCVFQNRRYALTAWITKVLPRLRIAQSSR